VTDRGPPAKEVILYFGSNDRSDTIEILLERESGDFITANYSPPPNKKRNVDNLE